MTLYRSGLRFSPPLGVGGHAFVIAAPGDAHSEKQGRARVWMHGTVESVWRCVRCFVLLPDWAVAEGFYPRPCLGEVAALAVPGVKWERAELARDEAT